MEVIFLSCRNCLPQLPHFQVQWLQKKTITKHPYYQFWTLQSQRKMYLSLIIKPSNAESISTKSKQSSSAESEHNSSFMFQPNMITGKNDIIQIRVFRSKRNYHLLSLESLSEIEKWKVAHLLQGWTQSCPLCYHKRRKEKIRAKRSQRGICDAWWSNIRKVSRRRRKGKRNG